MYLREFDIALSINPHEKEIEKISIEYGVTKEDAVRLWHKNIGNKISREFSLANRCIFSFYERIFEKIEISNFWKVYILVSPDIESPLLRCSGGVCDIYIYYEYSSFWDLDEINKKMKSLDLLMTGLSFLSNEYNFEYNYFEKYANIIKEARYVNEWVWARKKNGKKTAELRIFHNVNRVEIIMSVLDWHGNCLDRYTWNTNIPDEWEYVKFLGNLKWENKKTVLWLNKSGNIVNKMVIQ